VCVYSKLLKIVIDSGEKVSLSGCSLQVFSAYFKICPHGLDLSHRVGHLWVPTQVGSGPFSDILRNLPLTNILAYFDTTVNKEKIYNFDSRGLYYKRFYDSN
jgi:hypothetical protein